MDASLGLTEMFIMIAATFAIVGVLGSVVWIAKAIVDKIEIMIGRRQFQRIVRNADQSEILAARCKVLDAREGR